jgi:hypothetical protein
MGDGRNAPIHRDAAARLIAERRAGQTSPEDLMREPPMGPEAWARRNR